MSVSRICKDLGLNIKSQQEKLRGDRRFNCMAIHTVAADEKSRDILYIHLEHLAAWLFTINVNKVDSGIRPKLLAYQEDLMVRHLRQMYCLEKQAVRNVLFLH